MKENCDCNTFNQPIPISSDIKLTEQDLKEIYSTKKVKKNKKKKKEAFDFSLLSKIRK